MWRLLQTKSFSSNTFRILAMPRLSPSTTSAKIREWYLQKHDKFENYQLALRVETDSLLENEDGGNGTTHELDIEILEEGSVVEILVDASNDFLDVGTPLAIVSDDSQWSEDEAMSVDIFSKKMPLALWQAYKVDADPDSCGTCT